VQTVWDILAASTAEQLNGEELEELFHNCEVGFASMALSLEPLAFLTR
jgi:hypothetical protein